MKVKISNENGYPMFLINREKFSPLLFRSNRAEKRSVSEFYSAGVRLMGVFCTGLNCTLDVPYSLFGENRLGIKNYDFSTGTAR